MADLSIELAGELGGLVLPPPARADAYARQLKHLLPSGLLWKLEPGSWLSKLLLAIADELARIDERSDELLGEWDPGTTVELLPDWERVLGLPLGNLPLPEATADRQAAVVAAYVARGGQTAVYFVDLAARLGFVATVVEPAADTWRMEVDLAAGTNPAPAVTYDLRAGTGRSGDYLHEVTVVELETIIRRAAPAHTLVRFAYT